MGLNDALRNKKLFPTDELSPTMKSHLKRKSESSYVLVYFSDEDSDADTQEEDLDEFASKYESYVGFETAGGGFDLEFEDRADAEQCVADLKAGDLLGHPVESADAVTMEKSVRTLIVRKPKKTSGAATAQDRSEARLAESLSRLLACAEAANSFFIEGNQKEALAALEDLLAESKATRQAIETHAEKFPLEGELLDEGGEPVSDEDRVGEDGEAIDQSRDSE